MGWMQSFSQESKQPPLPLGSISWWLGGPREPKSPQSGPGFLALGAPDFEQDGPLSWGSCPVFTSFSAFYPPGFQRQTPPTPSAATT